MTGDDLLLHGFTITHITDCIADSTKVRVVAELSDGVAEVFPYLNTTVPNIMYNPGANTVTIRRGGRLLTIYPHVAVMAKIDDEQDAEVQLQWLQELCNDTWRRRGEIMPCYERRSQLGPLDVYQLLPRLNCRKCGEPTCMAFAFSLLFGEHALADCFPLAEPEHAEGGRRLAELIA
jgi:ArsR family metal-binding transcriptional regulator